jgi:hypothetical protein
MTNTQQPPVKADEIGHPDITFDLRPWVTKPPEAIDLAEFLGGYVVEQCLIREATSRCPDETCVLTLRKISEVLHGDK